MLLLYCHSTTEASHPWLMRPLELYAIIAQPVAHMSVAYGPKLRNKVMLSYQILLLLVFETQLVQQIMMIQEEIKWIKCKGLLTTFLLLKL